MNPKPGRRNLRLLMLPDQAYPSQEAVLVEVFARRLADHGVDVHWVMRGQQDGEFDWECSRVTVCRGISGIRARWALLVTLVRSMRIARVWRPDWIVARNGIALSLVAMLVRSVCGGRLAVQISFPFPEAYEALARARRRRGWRLRAWFWRARRLLRDWILRRCDLVLPISPVMAEGYLKTGVSPEKLWPLPMGAVIGDLPPGEDVDGLLRKLGLTESKVLLYVGAIAKIRQIDILIHAMPHVVRELPDACLLLLGPVLEPYKRTLQDLVVELDLDAHVHFFDPIPREDVTLWIAAADATISPIPMEDYYIVSSPTKAVESLAMGTPVVVTPIPDQKQLVDESGGGVCVDFTPDGLARGIIEMLQDPVASRRKGLEAREFVRSRRDYGVMASELAGRLRSLR